MDGGVGFGIRTATEGTPENLLKAIKEITFFTDDWEDYETKPTPSQLKDDPAKIEQVPMNYAVTQLTDEEGKRYFIVARRAYVGFDYGFYKNGMPTRPGNYVIDYYAFDSVPSRDVYEILYENALPGSNHFIPESVRPTTDNEEMIAISVGAQGPLAVEEKPFSANTQDELTKDAVKLFFYYLQAKSANQKLVVKVSRKNSNRLLADFYRMLGPVLSSEIRTYVNLRSQGTNDNFDIYFIHEDYPHQIYPGLYNYIEMDSAEIPDTFEAKTFANDIMNRVCSSYEENKEDADDLLKWVTMPEHDLVKNMSKETNDAFFSYCVQPGNFTYASLKESNGILNRELLDALCSYTSKSTANAMRFNEVVTEVMSDIAPDSVISLIKDYNELENVGFSLDTVTLSIKKKVCSVFLSDISIFRKLLAEVHPENISKFFCKELFEEKHDYLDSPLLDKYMTKLYNLFYTEEELQKKGQCLWRFMRRDIDKGIMFNLIDNIYQEQEQKIKFLINILHKELKPFNAVWEYLEHYLNNGADNTDFISEFREKTTDESYAPIFYYSLKKNRNGLDSLEKITQTSELLAHNKALKTLVEKGFSSDDIYSAYYKFIDAQCDEKPDKCLEHIKNNIFCFLNVNDNKWNVLKEYIELVININEGKEIGKLSKDRQVDIFNKIAEHKNTTVFNTMLNDFISLVRNNRIHVKALAAIYKKMNPQHDCITTLANLDSHKDWLEMAEAVIIDNFEMGFVDATQLLEEFGYPNQLQERFLSDHYKKEYKRYRLKHKIKSFFKPIISLFKRKDKEKGSSKENKTERKSKINKKA